ncbi:MAG: hypothetical protein RIS64_4195 [Bacteroidota bacterium]|jgi:hypothetical protein
MVILNYSQQLRTQMDTKLKRLFVIHAKNNNYILF